jgi:LPXTG-motif cell wall-anchored protein
MSAGETKTLTYKTTISGAQDAGLYTDLAFAKGVSGESILYANSEANPFVGTDVNVVLPDAQVVTVPEERDNDRVIKRKTKTQYVLGASTILPMTGVSALPLFLAVAGLLLGGGLLFLARRKTSLPVAVVLVVMGCALWLPGQASAGSLSVNIETPESMVTTPDFQIGFVTLDVLSRPLTVECYKDGEVAPFATYALASSFGGNSGNCQVNATVMPSDGTYTFYVKAIASGEGSDSVESSHVTVTLASVPGTPYNYSRTDGACQHTIAFTTANDGGKTVKVVLYRSASTTFTADAGTRVDEQMVGSNVSGNFVETAPSCSDDWFYALQAVDVNGNGSAFVGDVNVTVHEYTVTHRKTKTVTLPGGTSTASAIAVAPGTSGVGEVQGAETVNETEATVSGEKEELGAGSVLGEMSETTSEDGGSWLDLFNNHPWRSLFIAFILLLLGYYGYQYSQKKNYDQSAE